MKQEYASKIANELASYVNKDTVDESIAEFKEKKSNKKEEKIGNMVEFLLGKMSKETDFSKIEKFKEIVEEYMIPQTLPLQIHIDYNPPFWLTNALEKANIPPRMNIFPWKTVISFNEKGERS